MYHILSLDGGGIRGLLTCRLMEKIDLELPTVFDGFDLIAGTSTGAIPALALAAGKTPAEITQFYQDNFARVFADSLLDDVRDLYVLWGAQYGSEGLQEALWKLYGDLRLGDLLKKVLIPTIDLDSGPDNGAYRHWKAKLFHNFPGPDSDADERVLDVAMRSAAAPIYFPIYQGYIDGGLVANNPSMCALVQAIGADGVQCPLNEIALFSLGTGMNPKFIPEEEGDWGLVQWSYRRKKGGSPPLKYPLVELTFETNIAMVDYQCRQLLGQAYHRLDPLLTSSVDLDDGRQVFRLNQLAGRTDIAQTIDWLKRYVL